MLGFRFAESQSCKMQLYFMKIDFIENKEKNKEIKFPSRLVKFPRVSALNKGSREKRFFFSDQSTKALSPPAG